MKRNTINQERRRTCRRACSYVTSLMRVFMTLLLVLFATSSALADDSQTKATLEVNCKVTSNLREDQYQEFYFTVQLENRATNSTMGDMTFTNGMAKFKLKGGESIKAELPAGEEYTVTQEEAKGFETTMTGAEGTTSNNSPSIATFTNTRKPNLEVKAIVESEDELDYSPSNKKFSFTVDLNNSSINGPYGDMVFEYGVSTPIDLGHGESKTAILPPGTNYTVTQNTDDGFVTTEIGNTGTIGNILSTAEFINTSKANELSDNLEQGSAKITGYLKDLPGWCGGLGVVVKVSPKEGYITNLSLITVTDKEEKQIELYGGGDNVDGDPNPVSSDPADDPNSSLTYASPRTITLYFENVTPDQLTIKVGFTSLQLKSNLEHAAVTFYDGGTTEPSTTTFDPTASAVTAIDNSDGQDHYVIAHIVPRDDHWTDAALLKAVDAPSGTTVAANTLTLLKRDDYNINEGSTLEPEMSPLYDGAGWYYYKLPKEHSIANGYQSSTIDGFVVPKFDLDEGKGRVSQSGNVVTVTDGTENGWKALITLDKVSFPFNGSNQGPDVTEMAIMNGSETMISLSDPDIIGHHISLNNTTVISRNPIGISIIPRESLIALKGWFISSCWDADKAWFDITVPFSTDPASTAAKGSEANPWLITSAEELNLLAKCVNIGQYSFKGGFLQQTADITYDETTSADFTSIGGMYTPFCGTYDGGEWSISKLNYTTVASEDTDISNDYSLGLFGKVGDTETAGTIKNVKLDDCTFDIKAPIPTAVGGIAGWVYGSTVSNCSVSNSTMSYSGYSCAMGGIAGYMSLPSLAPPVIDVPQARAVNQARTRAADSYMIEDCTVDGCTISNVMTNSSSTDGVTVNNWTGGIAGLAVGGSLGRNRVIGKTSITSEVDTDVESLIGAIIGDASDGSTSAPVTTLIDNKYRKFVMLTRTNSDGMVTKQNYDGRGTIVRGAFADITDDEGAMMEVYPVSFSCSAPTGYTVPDGVLTLGTLTPGDDCHSQDNAGLYYFSPEDEITVTVNTSSIDKPHSDGEIRQMHAELSSLTLNDDETNFFASKTFTMPEGTATVKGTFTEADWFTVPSNQKEWMSFYHSWGSNYNVSEGGDGTSGTRAANPVELMTISSIDLEAGTAITIDLGGVSYDRVPTLFYSEGGLPALLRFDPATGGTAPQYDSQFKGGESDLSSFASQAVYLLFNSELVRADFSGSTAFDAYKAFVAVNASTAPSRLIFVRGETTAIDLVPALSEGEGKWFDLQGRKLNGMPATKGLYIMDGKKVVIK